MSIPPQRTIVIGDLHGDVAGLSRLLVATGAVDGQGRRAEARLIQLGDCIHGGRPRADCDDYLCLSLAIRADAELILGNHEAPHLFAAAGLPPFGGMRQIDPAIVRLLEDAWCGRRLQIAAAHEGWLITHAGLHPQLLGCARAWRYDRPPVPAEAAPLAAALRDAFAHRLERGPGCAPARLFDWIGPGKRDPAIPDDPGTRGGGDPVGGILWCDWDELLDEPPGPFGQIVGHTPQIGRPAHDGAGNRWCVDTGAALSGKVCAIVQDAPGQAWRPVVVESGR